MLALPQLARLGYQSRSLRCEPWEENERPRRNARFTEVREEPQILDPVDEQQGAAAGATSEAPAIRDLKSKYSMG